jgi:hypothetical protein
MQTWSDAQLALLTHVTSGFGQKGVTHDKPLPTMSMQAHARFGPHVALHGGADVLQAPETACADAGVADPRIRGAT